MNQKLILMVMTCWFSLSINAQTDSIPLRPQATQIMEVRSEHYYERVRAFKTEPPIERKALVMIGNSLTENGGDWGVRLDKKHVRNRGIIGDDASGIYDRLDEILCGKPKRICLMAGINDVSHNLSADSIIVLVAKLVDKIRHDSPRTQLFLQSLLPINESFQRYQRLNGKTSLIPVINEKLKAMAKERKIKFINLFPLFTVENTDMLRSELTNDGLHLNEEGYTIWSEELKKHL